MFVQDLAYFLRWNLDLTQIEFLCFFDLFLILYAGLLPIKLSMPLQKTETRGLRRSLSHGGKGA